jgi:hypothetical protein
MMLRPTLLLLIVSSLLYQSGGAKKEEQPEAYTDPDAYEVYSAILPRAWYAQEVKLLVIRSATEGYKSCLVPEKESQALVGPAISDYVKKNEKAWQLQPLFNLELRYQLITADESLSTIERGTWQRFFQEHPNSGGWIELSAVGFNDEKTVAVVYMGHRCPMMCGGGNFYVLQKKGGKWLPLSWKGTSCSWDI